MGDQLSALTLGAWHCLLRGIRRRAIRFQSLGEDPKAMTLCGTVCRQHGMSAVTVSSRRCQMCHLAAVAISSNSACRRNFLRNLVVGGGPWGSCSLKPFTAQQCHTHSWLRMPPSCMQPVCMSTYRVVYAMEVCWWWTL